MVYRFVNWETSAGAYRCIDRFNEGGGENVFSNVYLSDILITRRIRGSDGIRGRFNIPLYVSIQLSKFAKAHEQFYSANSYSAYLCLSTSLI